MGIRTVMQLCNTIRADHLNCTYTGMCRFDNNKVIMLDCDCDWLHIRYCWLLIAIWHGLKFDAGFSLFFTLTANTMGKWRLSISPSNCETTGKCSRLIIVCNQWCLCMQYIQYCHYVNNIQLISSLLIIP